VQRTFNCDKTQDTILTEQFGLWITFLRHHIHELQTLFFKCTVFIEPLLYRWYNNLVLLSGIFPSKSGVRRWFAQFRQSSYGLCNWSVICAVQYLRRWYCILPVSCYELNMLTVFWG